MRVVKKFDFLRWRVYEHALTNNVECKTLFGFRFYRRVGNIVSWFGIFNFVEVPK